LGLAAIPEEDYAEGKVLYLLAPGPLTLPELVENLKATFGSEIDVTRTIDKLVSLGLVRRFSFDNFSITPLGLASLERWIEGLTVFLLQVQNLGSHVSLKL
jgi:hypothetical protein